MITPLQANSSANSYIARSRETLGIPLMPTLFALCSIACAAARVAAMRGEEAALRWVGDKS